MDIMDMVNDGFYLGLGFYSLLLIIYGWFALYRKKSAFSYKKIGLIIGCAVIVIATAYFYANTDNSDGMFGPTWMWNILFGLFIGVPVLIVFLSTGIVRDYLAKRAK
jgi:hypothetical protein